MHITIDIKGYLKNTARALGIYLASIERLGINLCGVGLPAISPDPAIGTRIAPGLLQYLRLLPHEGALASDKWWASLQGRWQGWQTWQQSRFAEFGKDSP